MNPTAIPKHAHGAVRGGGLTPTGGPQQAHNRPNSARRLTGQADGADEPQGFALPVAEAGGLIVDGLKRRGAQLGAEGRGQAHLCLLASGMPERENLPAVSWPKPHAYHQSTKQREGGLQVTKDARGAVCRLLQQRVAHPKRTNIDGNVLQAGRRSVSFFRGTSARGRAPVGWRTAFCAAKTAFIVETYCAAHSGLAERTKRRWSLVCASGVALARPAREKCA